jgi:DNA-directed RNA polymerase specialized sigma24 family protein
MNRDFAVDYQAGFPIDPYLHIWATKKALESLPPCLPEDIEDMNQEAAFRIWRVAPNAANRANPEGYLYTAGKFAALEYWRRNVAQVKTYEDGRTGGFHGKMVSLDAPAPEWRGGDKGLTWVDIMPAPKPEESLAQPSPLLTQERISKIANWLVAYSDFFTTPHKRAQALRILNLLDRGYNTRGIAQQLNLSEKTVGQYRQEIRAALEKKAHKATTV